MRQAGSCSSDKTFRNKCLAGAGSRHVFQQSFLHRCQAECKRQLQESFLSTFFPSTANRRFGLVPAPCVLEVPWGAEVNLSILHSWKAPTRFHGVQVESGEIPRRGEVPTSFRQLYSRAAFLSCALDSVAGRRKWACTLMTTKFWLPTQSHVEDFIETLPGIYYMHRICVWLCNL